MNANRDATHSTLTRRSILFGATVAIVGGGVFASKWFNIFADASTPNALTVQQAYTRASAGEIYLIDVRRPDEWQRTGVSVAAVPLDMRRDDFETVLQSIFTNTGARPVALICARGVRSAHTTRRLAAAGFSDILDVPEGMLGSGAGAGYIPQGLALRAPTQREIDGHVLEPI